jgi:perosamine synthetase
MTIRIAHSKPFVGQAEKLAVSRVIASGRLAQGPQVARLEKELAAKVGHGYGIAVSSGTAALYCALKALKVDRTSDVIIPSYVCTALLNAVTMAGGRPVLADADPFTGNLTADAVKKRLTGKCRAVIVPHLFGYPADVAAIERLGVPVIEDCAQCVGAKMGGMSVGALSAISIFSFYATKLNAAGEGGMVATSDTRVRDRVIALREYDNRDTYSPAFNFKLSDVHAAIARVQLEKLPAMIRRRRLLAEVYRRELAGCGRFVQLPDAEPGVDPVYSRFVVTVAGNLDRVIQKLRRAGIECGRPVYKPLHRYLGLRGFPNTDSLQETALSLPIYPSMSSNDAAYVAGRLKKILEE